MKWIVKLTTGLVITLTLVMLLSVSARAEYLFLKNGVILNVKVETETDNDLTVIPGNGKKNIINRANVLRILFTDDYKIKKYIQLKSGEVIEGFIVAEDRYSYVIRKKLEEMREIVYSKSSVNAVSKTRPGAVNQTNIGVSVEPAFILPLFSSLRSQTKYGTGGLAGIDWLHVGGSDCRLGVRSGCWYMFPDSSDIKQLLIVPITLRFGYECKLPKVVSLLPVVDLGYAYNTMIFRPMKIQRQTRNSFEPMGMAGLDIMFAVIKNLAMSMGAKYAIIIEKKGVVHLMSFHANIEGRF